MPLVASTASAKEEAILRLRAFAINMNAAGELTAAAPRRSTGAIGQTGRVTGPHLHWELFVGGVQVDPLQWTRQSFP